jgi:RNA polymerase sigma-70 factor (ECF subfamily)
VAQNAAIDVIRKRRIQLVPLTRRADEGGEAMVDLELPDGQPSALESLQGRELDASIRAAIDTLPWEYRELILLRHYGELAYEEIAEVKAMPLGTVKNKLFRARQMLKQHLLGARDAGN